MNSNNSVALVRAIRGPIILITFGSLLALDRFGSYEFWRTWPALIIVFGLMKLLEKVVASQPARPEPQGGVQP